MNVKELIYQCHKITTEKGFNVKAHALQLLLIGTEIGEALECVEAKFDSENGKKHFNKQYNLGLFLYRYIELMNEIEKYRKNNNLEDTSTIKDEDHLIEEVCDILIRCFSYLGQFDVDKVNTILNNKIEYNATRPHKHGKKC